MCIINRLSFVVCLLLECVSIPCCHSQVVPLLESQSTTVRPIPVDVMLQEGWLYPGSKAFAVSPDSQLVAFVWCHLMAAPPVPKSSESFHTRTGMLIFGRGCALELEDVRSGAHHQLNKTGSIAFDPAWSPDGQTLAYYSDPRGSGEKRPMRVG
jgi:hypothetical protein